MSVLVGLAVIVLMHVPWRWAPKIAGGLALWVAVWVGVRWHDVIGVLVYASVAAALLADRGPVVWLARTKTSRWVYARFSRRAREVRSPVVVRRDGPSPWEKMTEPFRIR